MGGRILFMGVLIVLAIMTITAGIIAVAPFIAGTIVILLIFWVSAKLSGKPQSTEVVEKPED